ncbi:hypothetical protein TUM20286_55670 [Pseudomonas tohonis]|uniref:Peptidase C39 family protein n=1 Tax=Pseudomonas tohonis TaxID=2725477 RepID=A0ABQ4W8K6_9PSED|nr:hypothetical protein TUM20286_55670 [Pseudomonas tohonis]
MPIRRNRSLAGCAVLAFSILLAACSAQPTSPGLRGLPEAVELSNVPFFAQHAYQSAPAALAALFTLQGETVTPGMVEKELRLPEREEALQGNLADVVNRHGLLVYPLGDQVEDLLVQVAAGNPVLVHLRQGYGWLPSWRYALVVGYDRHKQVLLLRAGGERRLPMGFSEFESDWEGAGHWAVLLQAPNQLPAQVDAERWKQAADALAGAGQADAANIARKQLR